MTMDRKEIKEIFAEVVKEHEETKWPSDQVHFLHHQYFLKCLATDVDRVENHAFVSEIRLNLKAAKRSTFKAMLWLIGISASLLWAYSTAKVRGWINV